MANSPLCTLSTRYRVHLSASTTLIVRCVMVKNGRVVVEEIPGPVCPENGVLVQTAYSLISSGTERAALSGRSGDIGDEIRRAGGLAKKVMRRLSEGGVQATIRSIQDKISSSSLGISMGYSASGVVVECGLEVNDISVGDKVACAGEWAHHQEVLAVPSSRAGSG